MARQEEQEFVIGPEDPDLECTDGGWDPYVASLLMSTEEQTRTAAGEDDSAPVMSLSRGSKGRGSK